MKLREIIKRVAKAGTTPEENPNCTSEPPAPIYHPLDPFKREIQLLEVDQCMNGTGRLVCHLKTVSLLTDPSPEFEALSWCWGDTSHRSSIELSGIKFEIMSNVEEVLRRVCVDHGHHVVGIDAVCINQQDTAGRNFQVAMMVDVYSKAQRTIVWLGEGGGWVESAVSSLQMILQDAFNETGERVESFDLKHLLNRASPGNPLPPCDWKAVISFFPIPWLSRLWTLQVKFFCVQHNSETVTNHTRQF